MAASKIKGINIKIGADTQGLDKALDGIEGKSKSVRSELAEVNRSLKNNKDSVVLWEQKQQLLSKAFENSKEKLNMLESAQRDVNRQLENKAITGEQYRAFQRELENARAEAKRFGGQLEEAENKVRELKGTADKTAESAHDLGDDLHDAGEQAEKSSDGYTVLKGVIADLAAEAFGKLISAAKDAREEINEGYETIIKKTGGSGESLKEFEEIANNVFSKLPVDMNDVGAAVGEINTRFDVTGESLESLSETFLKYSRINDSNVNNSIDNVSAAMKAFAIDTEDTEKVLDTLSAVGQKTGIGIASLESTLVSNSATFKEMGLSIYESAQLLGQFEKNGVDTSTAITGLKKAQQEATKEGKTLSEALDENITAIKGAGNETEALQIATELFGKRGASAMAQAIREGRFELSSIDEDMSAFSGTVSSTFDTVQKEPDKLKVATNKIKLELAALAEKVMPKVAKAVEAFNDNLPKIINFLGKAKPVVVEIGAAFAAWKVGKIVKEATTAITGFGAALAANPVGLALVAVTGLTAGITALVSAHKEEETVLDRSIEKYKDQIEAIEKADGKINELKKSFDDQASTVDNECDRLQALKDELDDLTDASGHVKDADRKRVEYITNELNDALGLEMTLTNNQIVGYQNLSKEIDKLIEKRRYESIMSVYYAQSAEMAAQRSSTKANYLDMEAAFQEADKAYQDALAEFDTLLKNAEKNDAQWNTNVSYKDVIAAEGKKGGTEWFPQEVKDVADDIQQKYSDRELAWAKRSEAWRGYHSVLEWEQRGSEAETLASMGEYSKAVDAIYNPKDENQRILEDITATEEQRLAAYKETQDKITAELELALKTREEMGIESAQREANETFRSMEESITAALESGVVDATEIMTDDMRAVIQKMLDSGFDISGMADWMSEAGLTLADVFGENYTDVIQNQLDKGYDISGLAKWAQKSDIKMTDIFGENYTKVIQSQLDKGYDTTALLAWATDTSGKLLGKVDMEFLWKLQNRLNAGFSNDGLISWAEDTSMTLGDIMGGNIFDRVSNAAQRLFTPLKYTGIGNLPHFATGGYIPAGSSGIVAEAGPELLQVMNGGIKVTPLTEKARNTETSSVGSSQKIFYNTYNINNPKITNGMDVRRLAESLASEQRRIETGRGE